MQMAPAHPASISVLSSVTSLTAAAKRWLVVPGSHLPCTTPPEQFRV